MLWRVLPERFHGEGFAGPRYAPQPLLVTPMRPVNDDPVQGLVYFLRHLGQGGSSDYRNVVERD